MHEVNVGHKTLGDHRSIVPGELMAEIDELAAGLRGRRVLHVNATAFGGGVAEILYTLVPLTSDAGLPAEWRVITAPPEFHNVTKSLHNGLQCQAVDFPAAARELYESVCRANAADLTRAYDFVVIHDPQPLAMRDCVTVSQDRSTWWIWRCHIDTSTPGEGLYDYLLPSINRYDVAVHTRQRRVRRDQRLPEPCRRDSAEVHPRRLRSHRHRGAVEGPAHDRRRRGGIPLQIEDGVTGYLVKSAAQCAERCLEVLADPEKHQRMALAGQGTRAPRIPYAAAAARRTAALLRPAGG